MLLIDMVSQNCQINHCEKKKLRSLVKIADLLEIGAVGRRLALLAVEKVIKGVVNLIKIRSLIRSRYTSVSGSQI